MIADPVPSKRCAPWKTSLVTDLPMLVRRASIGAGRRDRERAPLSGPLRVDRNGVHGAVGVGVGVHDRLESERLRTPQVNPDLVDLLRVAELVVRHVGNEGLAA